MANIIKRAEPSELERSARDTLKHLRGWHPLRARVYGPEVSLSYVGNRIFVNRKKFDGKSFEEKDLGDVIRDEGIRSVDFQDFCEFTGFVRICGVNVNSLDFCVF